MSLQRTFATAAQKSKPRFRAALRELSERGVDALKPSMIIIDEATDERRWREPAISKRIANVMRKEAIREGTYGTFQANVGGWDPAWDVELAKTRPGGQGRYPQLRVSKKTSRQRTREERARKIERNMEGMDERMEALLAEKQAQKPADTFENLYKKLMRVKK